MTATAPELKPPLTTRTRHMLNRVKISERPATRTRWPISLVTDDGLGGIMIQINALCRWIFIYLD